MGFSFEINQMMYLFDDGYSCGSTVGTVQVRMQLELLVHGPEGTNAGLLPLIKHLGRRRRAVIAIDVAHVVAIVKVIAVVGDQQRVPLAEQQ